MVLYAGPEMEVHVNMFLLPAVVDHGIYHTNRGLAELFES